MLLLTFVVGIAPAAPAHADQPAQTVSFPSIKGEAITLVGHLRRPDGTGPFPAAVLLHGCASDWRGMDARWGTRLVKWGYVALSVDSYGPRGIKSTCGNGALHPKDQLYDAYGALSLLAEEPFALVDHAAVMGVSGGGTMALLGAELQSERNLPHQFHAAVALYPDCRHIDGPLTIPTLILSGELDNITPGRYCQELASGQHVRGRDEKVRLITFANAYHAFDNTDFPKRIEFLGPWLEYNADATARAVEEIRDFLGRHVQPAGR